MNSPFSQERIRSANIMVVGCGALGNEVLKNLALLGAQRLTVVDFDHVETGNLNRCILFSKDDAEAGRYKTEAVTDRLLKINPRMEVSTVQGDVAYDVGLGLMREMDVVIGCVDNRWARYCINRHCMRCGIPWVDGGIDTMEGTVRVFAPGENCYACNLGPEGLRDMTRRMPCSGVIRRNEEAGRAPTTSLTASVIGAVEVQEAMKLLHGRLWEEGEATLLTGRMFYYEGMHLTSKTVGFRAYDDTCPVHERWEPVRKSSLRRETTVEESLRIVENMTGDLEVRIGLHDDCFVDYIVGRENDIHREVMRPGREVAAFVEQDEELKGMPFSGMYQHEYKQVDRLFPYQELTLGELGIPARDVLHVTTERGDYYIETE